MWALVRPSAMSLSTSSSRRVNRSASRESAVAVIDAATIDAAEWAASVSASAVPSSTSARVSSSAVAAAAIMFFIFERCVHRRSRRVVRSNAYPKPSANVHSASRSIKSTSRPAK